jgi:hypothetical protein
MKNMVIFKKTQSTVTDHLECGLFIYPQFMFSMKSTTILFLGIGIKLQVVKMAKNKESDLEMHSPQQLLKTLLDLDIWNGVLVHMILITSETGSPKGFLIQMT